MDKIVNNILGKKKKGKRKCKYCGQVHKYEPFTDCHNPNEPIPDSLEEGYMSLGYE